MATSLYVVDDGKVNYVFTCLTIICIASACTGILILLLDIIFYNTVITRYCLSNNIVMTSPNQTRLLSLNDAWCDNVHITDFTNQTQVYRLNATDLDERGRPHLRGPILPLKMLSQVHLVESKSISYLTFLMNKRSTMMVTWIAQDVLRMFVIVGRDNFENFSYAIYYLNASPTSLSDYYIYTHDAKQEVIRVIADESDDYFFIWMLPEGNSGAMISAIVFFEASLTTYSLRNAVLLPSRSCDSHHLVLFNQNITSFHDYDRSHDGNDFQISGEMNILSSQQMPSHSHHVSSQNHRRYKMNLSNHGEEQVTREDFEKKMKSMELEFGNLTRFIQSDSQFRSIEMKLSMSRHLGSGINHESMTNQFEKDIPVCYDIHKKSLYESTQIVIKSPPHFPADPRQSAYAIEISFGTSAWVIACFWMLLFIALGLCIIPLICCVAMIVHMRRKNTSNYTPFE